MITFACLVPHSPILIPEVGKENLEALADTVKALQGLEHDLYASKPDLLLFITSHANNPGPAFVINQAPKLKVNFKKFGDLISNLEFTNDIGLGYKIKEACETSLAVNLVAEEELTYSTGVPLFYLAQHLAKTKIVVINYAHLSFAEHVKFGEVIKEQISNSGQRVAVIACGDLSHRLHQDSPAGFSPRGQEFDQLVIKLISNKDLDGLVNFDETLRHEAKECIFRALLILLGIIKDIDYVPEKLAYQAPFGIGYLTENFKVR